LKEAHERYRDKVTDKAGGFPAAGSGGNANAIAERQRMKAEEDARLFKSVAEQISEILRQYQPLRWSFAAPAEINPAILERIPSDLRRILDSNVKRDLVKIPTDSLLHHFK
jgi:Protein required for attachment to host cells